MRNCSMYPAWDSRVVGRIDARVDSRYRNHRCTVHANHLAGDIARMC